MKEACLEVTNRRALPPFVPALADASRPVYFTEQLTSGDDNGAPAMTFDYRLPPGLATSTNALQF